MDNLATLVSTEIGAEIPYNTWGYDWSSYFEKSLLKDVLDTVTMIFHLVYHRDQRSAAGWLQFVERVFREENTCYTVDATGCVHFRVDRELEANRASTLAGLEGQRYFAARELFERGFAALQGIPPETNGAIRGVFDAVETAFRLAFPQASRLGAAELDRFLKPEIQKLYTGNDAHAAKLLCSSIADWVNSAHHYRHSPGVEEPAPAPLDVAVALVSAGTGHLRWLIHLDQAISRAS